MFNINLYESEYFDLFVSLYESIFCCKRGGKESV